MLYQEPLDARYSQMPPQEVLAAIARRKGQLGRDLVILGHHYQRDEVFQFADFTGDSLRLSQQAATTSARYIVFCGVHFMAESADVLTAPEQAVILPDLSAGCAMAEMADAQDVQDAWERIARATSERVVPVTYVNSSAAVKAWTARAGGACCTSSNAAAVFAWALGAAGGAKVLAMPDQHLARNMAVAMGFGPDDCLVYDPRSPDGGATDAQIRAARFLLWRGHCYVHQRFTVEAVREARGHHPGITVMVHPECPYEVVQAADLAGSTEQILRTVSTAPAGSAWAIGTEANMVARLARKNPDKFVRSLAATPPMCVTMARIDPPHLLWVLDNLAEGRVVNRVSVEAALAADVRVALERMLAAPAAPGPLKR